MNKIQTIIASIMNDPAPLLDNWSHHNCPACTANGQPRSDTRGRGNHMFKNDGSVLYNCYNCNLKIVWTPGNRINSKMELLLNSYGASRNDIEMIKFIANEMINSGEYESTSTEHSKIFERIVKRDLPPCTKSFLDWTNEPIIPDEFLKVLNAVNDRNPYLLDAGLYWSPVKEKYMFERFIIPYYMNGNIIGYTARHIDLNSKYRYYNQVSTGIFYNFDLLNDNNIKTILVAEGPVDALLMGGISANNYFLTSGQIENLKKAQERNKKIVIVPDRDKNGLSSIEQAITHGFSVAFPDYGNIRDSNGIRRIKDFDEACAKYGRLFCLQLLYNSIYDDEFSIRVQMENWI